MLAVPDPTSVDLDRVKEIYRLFRKHGFEIAPLRTFGQPLTDEDRWPWLAAIAAHIDIARAEGRHAIVSCSALKRVYRDILIGARDDVRLVLLDGTKEEIFARMRARKDHFMPLALLDSQFATLERPGVDERPVVVSIDGTPEKIADVIIAGLGS